MPRYAFVSSVGKSSQNPTVHTSPRAQFLHTFFPSHSSVRNFFTPPREIARQSEPARSRDCLVPSSMPIGVAQKQLRHSAYRFIHDVRNSNHSDRVFIWRRPARSARGAHGLRSLRPHEQRCCEHEMAALSPKVMKGFQFLV